MVSSHDFYLFSVKVGKCREEVQFPLASGYCVTQAKSVQIRVRIWFVWVDIIKVCDDCVEGSGYGILYGTSFSEHFIIMGVIATGL